MGDERPVAELPEPRAVAELPSGLSGPKLYHTLDGRNELS
jgi:hypothetical protein